MQVTPIRLDAKLLKRLDKHAERMRRDAPGLRATRSDALRTLLNEALDRAERLERDGKA